MKMFRALPLVISDVEFRFIKVVPCKDIKSIVNSILHLVRLESRHSCNPVDAWHARR